jgi:hypothetical protein
MRDVVVAETPWGDAIWAEMKPLAEKHAREVDGGVEPRRRFKLDEAAMRAMAQAGILHLIIARAAGKVVGYFTWNIQSDVESEGLLIAMQGAWYLEPGFPRLAAQMWDASIDMLRSLGVQMVFPHHRTQGRGSGIGRFFRKRGAKHIQDTYSLWIGVD